MKELQLAESIVSICTDMDGFLIKLRASHFDETQYDHLIALLQEYREVLTGSRVMDRRVAGCLLELEQQLFIQVERHQNAQYLTPGKQQIDYAFNEIIALNASIFWQ